MVDLVPILIVFAAGCFVGYIIGYLKFAKNDD